MTWNVATPLVKSSVVGTVTPETEQATVAVPIVIRIGLPVGGLRGDLNGDAAAGRHTGCPCLRRSWRGRRKLARSAATRTALPLLRTALGARSTRSIRARCATRTRRARRATLPRRRTASRTPYRVAVGAATTVTLVVPVIEELAESVTVNVSVVPAAPDGGLEGGHAQRTSRVSTPSRMARFVPESVTPEPVKLTVAGPV